MKEKQPISITLTGITDQILIIPFDNIAYIKSMNNHKNGCHIILKFGPNIDVQETWTDIQDIVGNLINKDND